MMSRTEFMTDKEIIKALECLHKRILQSKFAEEVTETEIMGLVGALDLINRQQAEIERLKAGVNVDLENYASEYDSKIKAEAIKEFAERLKEKAPIIEGLYHKTIKPISCATIDNLVKEMVGG